jgi:type IV pilus assembly protein PilM
MHDQETPMEHRHPLAHPVDPRLPVAPPAAPAPPAQEQESHPGLAHAPQAAPVQHAPPTFTAFVQPQAAAPVAPPAAFAPTAAATAVPAPSVHAAATAPVAAALDAPTRPPRPRSALAALRKRRPSAGNGSTAVPAARVRHATIGLKIGASQLAAAVVSNSGTPTLVTAVRQPLPGGIVVGGEVRQPEALAEALDAFFAAHKLPKRNVRIGLGSDRVGVRIFERPQVEDPKQLANAIRFRAHEALPIPIEEAMLDYHLLPGEDGPGRVLLVVTYREVVERFGEACRAAQLDLAGADLEAFALLRAVAGRHDAANMRRQAALVVAAVGHDRSTVAVSDGRICEFTRVLDWGGAKLTKALADSLRVPEDEAERTKRTLSLAGLPHDADPTTQRATAAVRRELQTLARELTSTLKFYQGQPESLSIGEIALTGGTSHLPGLAEELERVIGVRVRVADPLARFAPETVEEQQIGSLSVAIGLGIEE